MKFSALSSELLGGNELHIAKRLEPAKSEERGTIALGRHLIGEDTHLLLKVDVTLGELFVYLGHAKKRAHMRLGLQHPARNLIGRREPHGALVAVVVEQKHKACHLQQHQ